MSYNLYCQKSPTPYFMQLSVLYIPVEMEAGKGRLEFDILPSKKYCQNPLPGTWTL